jgi:hypothetical protein
MRIAALTPTSLPAIAPTMALLVTVATADGEPKPLGFRG